MAATPLPNPPDVFGALIPWADLGLRTFGTLLGAGQPAGGPAEGTAESGQAEPAAQAANMATPMLPLLSAWGQWQGASLEWMTQAWQQWFSLWAGLNPVMARGEGGPGSALQAAPFAFPAPFGATAQAQPARAAGARRDSAERASADLEHAVASAGGGRPGRAKPKARAARKRSRRE